MPRKKRPLSRETGALRDASLLVIASEDRYAVKDYFARFKTSRVFISVIPTEDTRSAPQHVLQRIQDFISDYVTEDRDTFWLCIDRDRWSEGTLREVHQLCRQKGYEFVLSNPCFELWLLLHHETVEQNPSRKCDEVSNRLRAVLGGYTKQCCQSLVLTKEMILAAMERARAMDQYGDNPLPPAMLTGVYRILDAILSRENDIRLYDLTATQS